MFKMKNRSQYGIGLLPVMIVVLLTAITGISYNVYLTREKQAVDQASIVSNEQAAITPVATEDIPASLSDTILSALAYDPSTNQEMTDNTFIMKDDNSGLFVQVTNTSPAVRYQLSDMPSKQAIETIMSSFYETMEVQGFSHFSGHKLDDSTTSWPPGSSAFQKENTYCYITTLISSFFDIGCVQATEAELEDIVERLKPLYTAKNLHYHGTESENSEYPYVITLLSQEPKIIHDAYEVYEGGLGGVQDTYGFYEITGGGRISFYREKGGDWQVGANSGQAINNCDQYNNTAQQVIFAEEACWVSESAGTSTVKEYWQ